MQSGIFPSMLIRSSMLIPVILVAVGIIIGLFLFFFISNFLAFREELHDIEVEIERSSGKEQEHYLRKKKSLCWSF